MTYLYIVLTLALLALLTAGIVEQRRHERHLRSIRIRVLVNGIRGKSSITRLVAGALRGGDLRVVAKTTGTAARFDLPRRQRGAGLPQVQHRERGRADRHREAGRGRVS